MKVLITGINGFFGLKLANYLLSKNIQVHGLGRNKKPKCKGIHYYQIDVSTDSEIDYIVKKCDVIFHFAAITSHNDIVNNPHKTEKININGTRLLLDSIDRQTKSKIFIFASTGKVYGKYDSLPLHETHATKPMNMLGRIKRNTEKYIASRTNNKDKYIILRIFNVYGPGQKENFLIPTILRQIQNNCNKKIYRLSLGNIDHQRDYIYIDDLIQLFYKIIKSKLDFGISYFNVGSGIPINVKTILKNLESLLNIKIKVSIMKSKLRNDESEVEYCSTKKISDLCEWKPKIDLETGIKKCINEDYKTLTKLINIG